ncbi:prepilin-type N-terminal cleavage/methylation domain-containing protein [Vibrio campbellii]|uniref:type IV pilin protein n=1 Tax=Vibrio campbellii TaxID=680 RepID=UPI0005EE1D79|nr:prepilin-type N-terminal cleavage/methylation domain-containing protein [Vibrio campbellii]APX05166.1 prepilin-type N-terminal cleavage/methylation domain-containing protein [Vibrio campbellii]ARR05326.1 type IV pilin [Vibrio campbellii]HDM8220400.1 prepilin-type N-terminal cleavage/methylation domain-containing protein [Vibrio campbellii]
MKTNKQKKQQGFTLIELMIVVAIIGVLSAIAVPAYKNYVTKSEVASAVASLKSVITPAELFYQEKGTFPASEDDLASVGINSSSIQNGTLGFASSAIELNISSLSPAKATITRESTGWKCAVSGLTDATNAPKGCPQA